MYIYFFRFSDCAPENKLGQMIRKMVAETEGAVTIFSYDEEFIVPSSTAINLQNVVWCVVW